MTQTPKRTVSVAECATCGAVAAEFGKHSGASDYFKGGIITYDNTLKTEILGIPEEVVDNFRDDPYTVLGMMAKNVAQFFQSQIGLATSGYASSCPEKGITTPYIWYAIHDTRSQNTKIHRVFNIDNELTREEFQQHLGRIVYERYNTTN